MLAGYVVLCLALAGWGLSGRWLDLTVMKPAGPVVPWDFAAFDAFRTYDEYELLGLHVRTRYSRGWGESTRWVLLGEFTLSPAVRGSADTMRLVRSFRIPLWPLMVPGCALMAWWLWRRAGPLLADLRLGRRVRRRMERLRRLGVLSRCPRCRYDLRATPGWCPECGRGVRPLQAGERQG